MGSLGEREAGRKGRRCVLEGGTEVCAGGWRDGGVYCMPFIQCMVTSQQDVGLLCQNVIKQNNKKGK